MHDSTPPQADLESSTPPVAHRALCPTCGRLADREKHTPYHHAGVHVSLYACERAHLWQTEWAEVA